MCYDKNKFIAIIDEEDMDLNAQAKLQLMQHDMRDTIVLAAAAGSKSMVLQALKAHPEDVCI